MWNDHALGRAQFGGAGLAGARRFDPTELLDDTPQMGLVREATYCWGTCRNGVGDLFIFARRIAAPSGAAGRNAAAAGAVQHSMSDRFILQSTVGADHPRLRREGRLTATSEDVQRSLDSGAAVFWIDPRNGRGAMDLVVGGDSARYREADVLDLSGPRVGPGLHWYLPFGQSALYYTSATWPVAGMILNQEVEGFLFVEEAYTPPGGRLYVKHDPLRDVRYRLWYSWATEWDDGAMEFGHFLANDGPFSVGLVADDACHVSVAQTVNAKVERDPDGYWFDRIALDVDGESWEIVADPKGRMADLGAIPNPQQEGHVRRVGETRTPVRWMAWGESVPAHDAPADERPAFPPL
jgi:hypothetical protein